MTADTLVLPAVLDAGAATALRDDLSPRRGSPLTLRGAAVDRLSALALQVLLSARRTWTSDGLELRLEAPSPALEAALRQFGAAGLFDLPLFSGDAA